MATLPVLVGSDEDWTPSNYMPDVRTEIAFNAGYVTPSADRVWTDVSEWVELHEGIDIGVGRQDERSVADANDLTLTLDNKDGRFTAKRAASPYYPNVKVGRPIRVSVLTQTGHTSVRFVGFIDGWPVEWDGSDAYAKTQIKATSRLSRLGLTATLKSFVEQEILSDGPTLYYTMGDPAGSLQASEGSDNSGAPLVITGAGTHTITFGATSTPELGSTACAFTVGINLRYLGTAMPAGTTASSLGVGCFFSATNPAFGGGQRIIGYPTDDHSTGRALIEMNATGKIVAGFPGVTVTSANSYDDETIHHAFITTVAGTLTLYIDGVSVGSVGGVPSTALTEFSVGQQFDGWIGHVELYAGASPVLPSAARIAEHAEAGIAGFTGERTDERLLRILGMAGVASTEVGSEVGSETMTYQSAAGMSVVEALRECEETEGGVLFDGRDGSVEFHNRAHRYLADPAATLDMAAQHVESDYAPRLDRSTLVNDVTVSNPITNESARAVDSASSDEYGVATGSASSLADSYTPLQERASWHIVSYAEPRMRCPSLTVDVLAHVGLTPSAEDLLDVTVGDLLSVINAPTQSDTTTPSYFVEGYTESIGVESYRITYNTSPTYPTLDVFVLDDADRGVLDTDILGY